MDSSEDRFDLQVGDLKIKTPIAVASMAGIVDADYVIKRAEHIGIGFIGGYAVDGETQIAAAELLAAGRKEFMPADPVAEIKKQIEIIAASDVVPAVNLRASKPESLVKVAEAVGDKVIYEIDAHCRQKPMMDAGCGEILLTDTNRLIAYVQALKIAGVIVSVKIRAGINENDPLMCHKLWKAGADIIHVDLMDFGHEKIRQIRNECPALLIANNSVNNFERMKDLFSHGADMVSLARQSDVDTLAELDTEIHKYAKEHGWYNSPKQLCRGGDIRALAFCCMPVKPCPLLPFLEKYKITPQEFVEMKTEAVKGTPLEGGENTCFGSLVYCCKDSTPCMFRDMALKQASLKKSDYMKLKRKLSEYLVKRFIK